MLEDTLLSEFADSFLGYGDYRAKYWFVGMEEGGGNNEEEIQKRLTQWHARGKRELEDLAEFHRRIGIPEFFAEKPKFQPTWNKLIRLLKAAKGERSDKELIRRYQAQEWGRFGGETALLELLPLPSPSTNKWLYGSHSALPQLTTREAYHDYYAPMRVKNLRAMIQRHQPLCVIFYGVNYMRWWNTIAAIDFLEIQSGKHRFWKGKDGQVIFFVVVHPAAIGITNDYFHEIGRVLKENE